MNPHEIAGWIGYIILLATLVYVATIEKSVYLGLALLGIGIICVAVVRYMVVEGGY